MGKNCVPLIYMDDALFMPYIPLLITLISAKETEASMCLWTDLILNYFIGPIKHYLYVLWSLFWSRLPKFLLRDGSGGDVVVRVCGARARVCVCVCVCVGGGGGGGGLWDVCRDALWDLWGGWILSNNLCMYHVLSVPVWMTHNHGTKCL